MVSSWSFMCPSVLPSVFSFLEQIFTKLGMCIDSVEIWFGIANRQISSILTELSARDTSIFLFLDDNLSKCQWIFTKLHTFVCALILWRSGSGLLMGKFYLPGTHPYFPFRTITSKSPMDFCQT